MISTLLLEDDDSLSQEISLFLRHKGISCETAPDGKEALRIIRHRPFDLFLLDIDVPQLNGIEVCSKIRENNLLSPIIMLTAFGEIEDKASAFSSGADDYLVKPFHLDELYLRIMALHRRRNSPQAPADILTIHNLSIDRVNKKAERGGKTLLLTPKEFKLLQLLMTANGRVVSKQEIAENIWGDHIDTTQNTIEVYINFLRNKIDKNFPEKLIHTRVGFGYYLKLER